MTSSQTKNLSFWWEDINIPKFSSLSEDLSVDVCIIGAGIAGLTTAYQLTKAGKSVIVIEDGEICSGESGQTTAHLANGLDDHYYEIERIHGEEGAKLAAQSHTAAINFIENMVNEHNIECDFRRVDGYLFVAPNHPQNILDKELAASHRAGLSSVEIVPEPSFEGFNPGPCLKFPQQAQFHPLKYLAKLAQLIIGNGGKIFTNTHAKEIKAGKPAIIYTSNDYSINANELVIATNAPIHDECFLFAKLEPYRTYVIAANIPKGSVTTALYWDTEDPYHYVRLQPLNEQEDLIIIGGEDHRTGHMQENVNAPFEKLEAWARERFPQMINVKHRWSGQVIEPVDLLAFIGAYPKNKNIYVVTGDSGNGMTHGTIAGLLITDLILGKQNKWAELYDPARKRVYKEIKEIALHHIEGSSGYIKHILPGNIKNTGQLAPGQAAIIQKGFTKIAAYRDLNGELHLCSAVCSHMKAVVNWNAQTCTWDCPAHGSRFSIDGEVINGPAIKPLEEIEEAKILGES